MIISIRNDHANKSRLAHQKKHIRKDVLFVLGMGLKLVLLSKPCYSTIILKLYESYSGRLLVITDER